MKKIILFILVLPNLVFAQTLYTDFLPYLNTTEYLEETDLIKRSEIKLYNTYIEQVEENYLSLDENQIKEYQIDYNDYIYQYTNSLENREYAYSYQTKCLNENYTPRSLTISNFSDNVSISEVKALSKNLNGVGISITNYSGFMSAIANGIINEKPIEFNKDSTINFTFFKNIAIDELQIELYLPKQNLNQLSFTITSKEGIALNAEVDLQTDNNIITINFDNNYYNFLKENSFTTSNNCISYYNLKIPLYKHYKIVNLPTNNYIPLNNFDKFILDDYQTHYYYYKREKIEIEDRISIKKEHFNLENYLISSTIPLNELKVIDNINYEKDGIYTIDIYYQNKLLLKKQIEYIKKNTKEKIKKEEYITSKKTNNTKTIKINNTKTTTTNIKQINNKIITKVKENKFQKTIFIIVLSTLLLILITFECILLYVKKKYY